MPDPRGKFVYYKGDDGDWYWRYIHANGNEQYRSTEGYRNKADCLKSIPRCNAVESAFRIELTDE
jgi:uncharacterized protein YegP (UPF0339 family)